MELNELKTLALLIEAVALIERAIVREGGRLVDAPGDNVLAEFTCESSALRCAIWIQHALAERNLRRCEGDRLLLRIGLHSGLRIHRADRRGHAARAAAAGHVIEKELHVGLLWFILPHILDGSYR